MEWLSCIRKTIDFMESHLHDEISVQDVSDAVNVSQMFLQKGFSIMTGYGIGEYLRNRRLYEAAIDLISTDDKIIDIAYSYMYETPESFTKAFSRFHRASPSQIRSKEAPIKTFLPLRINISISGGYIMDYRVLSKAGLKVIGFEKSFSMDTCNEEIPKFWDEMFETYAKNVVMGGEPVTPHEKAIVDCNIGEYGICIDDEQGSMRYLIAGDYHGGEIPEGMSLFEFPEGDWAIFDCYGPMPKAIQNITDRIFNEWLPGNPDYELAGNASVEWYEGTNKLDPDYHSAVWIPVRKK
ncbi:MAG: AraC family transcriptional regulator [Clostridia bacterium]|nr:AraC family transcriptional regulator [Clostridia bacterium]